MAQVGLCLQALLSGVTPHATIPSLLALLARSAELAYIHIRCASGHGESCEISARLVASSQSVHTAAYFGVSHAGVERRSP